MRAAVYAAPAPDSALGGLAAAWLGRDAFTGEATRAAGATRDPLVAEPARYGFHATLRAPFRPKPGIDLETLSATLDAMCAGRPAPVIARLTLARLGAFFALVPGGPEPALQALEGAVLDAFEPFRAPLTEAEVARRSPERLSARQREHLAAWGYPFVHDDFRFHMTLTGPVPGSADELHRDLATHFAPVLDRPLPLDGLGLFVEPEAGAPFRVRSFHPFGSPAARHPAGTP